MPDYVPNSAEQLIALRDKLNGLLLMYRKLEAQARTLADAAGIAGNAPTLMRQGAREGVYNLVADDIEAILNGE